MPEKTNRSTDSARAMAPQGNACAYGIAAAAVNSPIAHFLSGITAHGEKPHNYGAVGDYGGFRNVVL